MDVKIGDFGLAVEIASGQKRISSCGTISYMAPETLNRSIGHSFEVDVWALGVIMYELLLGESPFKEPTSKEMTRRIREVDLRFPTNTTISQEARDLITLILCKNPADRPSYAQILQHPFFTKNEIPKFLPIRFLVNAPNQNFIN